jgi:hypothetical protein
VKEPISRLLFAAGAHVKKADRIAHLQFLAKQIPAIKVVLKFACDPNIKFALPEGETPYKPSEYDEPGILYSEIRRLYIFCEGGHATLKRTRRETLWIELLGAVHREDAKLLDLIKDKKLPDGLKPDIVLAAFPDLF